MLFFTSRVRSSWGSIIILRWHTRTRDFIRQRRLFGYFAYEKSTNHVPGTQPLCFWLLLINSLTNIASVGTLFTVLLIVSPIATELRLLFQCGGSKPTTGYIRVVHVVQIAAAVKTRGCSRDHVTGGRSSSPIDISIRLGLQLLAFFDDKRLLRVL